MFGVSDHPGAPSLEAAPYRACAVAPPLLCKEGNISGRFTREPIDLVANTEFEPRNFRAAPTARLIDVDSGQKVPQNQVVLHSLLTYEIL